MARAVRRWWEQRGMFAGPVCLLVVAVTPALAAEPLRWISSGSLTASLPAGDRIYAVVGEELLVLRRSGRSAEVVGRAPVGGLCFGLAAAEVGTRRLVVATIYNEGVQAFDVSDPSAPRETGFALWPASIFPVVVLGDHAYVSCYEGLVRAFALDPAGVPRQEGELKTTGTIVALAMGAQAAYALDTKEGLVPLDLTDPANPRRGTPLAMEERPAGTLVLNDSLQLALLVTSTGDLLVADTHEPLEPVWRGKLHLPFSVEAYTQIVFRDRTALVIGPESMVTVDLSDPQTPQAGQSVPMPRGDRSLSRLEGDTLLIADRHHGLMFYDAAQLDRLREAGRFAVPGYALGLAVVDGRAYASRASREIEVLPPVSELLAAGPPPARRAVALPVVTPGLAASGEHLVGFTVTAKLQVYTRVDSEAAEARPVAELALPATVEHFAVDGTNVAVSLGKEGVGLVDLSQPAEPVLLAQRKLDQPVTSVALRPGRVYAGTARGVVVLRLRDGQLVECGKLDTPMRVGELASGEDLLFVTTKPSGLLVCDLTDPDVPVVLGRAQVSAATTPPLLLGHHLLYGTYGDGGAELVAVDLTDLLTPRVVQRWKLVSVAYALCRLDDRHALVSNFSKGVAVVTVGE